MRLYYGFALTTAMACTYAVAAPVSSIYPSYYVQALQIYQNMNEEERIGQLLLPSYVLLANAVSPNGERCAADVNAVGVPEAKMIHDCGLDQIAQYHLGGVLTGAGPYFNASTLQNWVALNALAQQEHVQGQPSTGPVDPLLLTGSDVIHGNMHVEGAVIFPHNMGLGVTHDPRLVEKIGQLAGQDSLASGFNWAFMPTVAVAQDLRWGRSYESFSADPRLVKEMARAYVTGFQDIQGRQITGVLSTAKHFIGDGATQYGFDEGDDQYKGDEQDFWNENGQGYEGAVQADVGSIMASYSAINGDNTRMHFGGNWDIVNQFKTDGIPGSDGQTYKFNGFVVSDWNGHTRAAYFYDQASGQTLTLPEIMAKTINAGVDMIMLGQGDTSNPFKPQSPPNFTNVKEVFDATKQAVDSGLIPQARLQDAVIRILEVKLALAPHTPSDYAALQAQERPLALRAAEESLVLLKNTQQTLPVNAQSIKNVVFIGDTDDLGVQNGGWTINWQGQKGSVYFTGPYAISSGATTIEQGVRNVLGNRVHYYYANNFQEAMSAHAFNHHNTLIIAAVAEVPYAEFMGDIGNAAAQDPWYNMGAANGYNLYLGLPQSQWLGLSFTSDEAATIEQLKDQGARVITVVYSGRPVILSGQNAEDMTGPINSSDAVIAAFLPGTLGGQAVANAIFGQYHFRANGYSNTLTFAWPVNLQQVSDHFQSGSLFPIGYGLKD